VRDIVRLLLSVELWRISSAHDDGPKREGLRKDHYRRAGEYVDAILMAYRLSNDG
jgi:hypothetical protein